jgi:hypothetical protein
MTKKQFKTEVSFHQYGKKRIRLNAIYWGWDTVGTGVGYKYMVKGTSDWCSKKELFDAMYEWIFNEVVLPWYIDYRYADTEEKRFKVKIQESF